ncbi:MAG: hypothetical protein EZS28_009987 [Streblomastix strix]|uniref:Uncharacterized protein n=1 Tax=Streblomastix strix TaxID=222440 RepID=A0A5J4WI42_9EUKA|nr:MAG: hypothetical protein EZS28_009987 [Streblomastix strix]
MLIFFSTWITPHFTSMDIDIGMFLEDIKNRGTKVKKGKDGSKNKKLNELSPQFINKLLNSEPNLSSFTVPQSLDLFFNGPNASMQDSMYFNEATERIKLKQDQNQFDQSSS